MCLGTIHRGKRKKEALAKLPKMVTCYKVVLKRANQYGSKYFPEMFQRDKPFLVGWNKTEPVSRGEGYWIAYHAFLTKEGAKTWTKEDRRRIVQCKTAKKDITAIGTQYYKDQYLPCLVTKRIWIPKPN